MVLRSYSQSDLQCARLHFGWSRSSTSPEKDTFIKKQRLTHFKKVRKHSFIID